MLPPILIIYIYPNYARNMAKNVPQISIPDEVLISKIYLIRDQKVMLDRESGRTL